MNTPRVPTHEEAREAYPVTQAEIIRLVAGPYMWHHKMDDDDEREAKAFDRCRELTIEKIKVHFATLKVAHAHPAEAVSGDRAALAAHLQKLIGEYWGYAYREGQENRVADTPEGHAGKCLSEIQHTIRLLLAAAPPTPSAPCQAEASRKGEDAPEGCDVHWYSSRVCARGTKSCEARHNDPPPEREAAEDEATLREFMGPDPATGAVNEWREAVLDALANTGADCPTTWTPAQVIEHIVDCRIGIAQMLAESTTPAGWQPENYAAYLSLQYELAAPFAQPSGHNPEPESVTPRGDPCIECGADPGEPCFTGCATRTESATPAVSDEAAEGPPIAIAWRQQTKYGMSYRFSADAENVHFGPQKSCKICELINARDRAVAQQLAMEAQVASLVAQLDAVNLGYNAMVPELRQRAEATEQQLDMAIATLKQTRADLKQQLATTTAENEQARQTAQFWKDNCLVRNAEIKTLREQLADCEAALREAREALLFAERHCPCGARPESLGTHPHVIGCLIGKAVDTARAATKEPT